MPRGRRCAGIPSLASASGIVTAVPPDPATRPLCRRSTRPFPVLRALYLRKTFGRWGLLMLGYAAIVWFAVVYVAERWLIDVALGVVLTVLAGR